MASKTWKVPQKPLILNSQRSLETLFLVSVKELAAAAMDELIPQQKQVMAEQRMRNLPPELVFVVLCFNLGCCIYSHSGISIASIKTVIAI